MKAFFADKALFRPVLPPLHLRSRDMALALALGDEDQLTVHEQAVDPMIYRAASELIRLDDEGTKTNIEAQGQVFDVLQTIEEQLAEVGASRFAASQILDSLKFYVSGLGADFARQAKAKPLYARVMVTDKEPTDMPDCKVSSLTCIDGNRIQGDDAGKMGMTLTLYGTSNAMTQGMSMERVFESGKKKWVMVYYGTIEGADLNKFDTVDADLATLIQAVGAGGGASVKEIRAAIENGTLAPEVKQLIAAIAALNRTVEAARTPGAIENPEAKIAELKAAIAEIVQTIPDMQALPQVLLQAVAESIAPVDIAPETPDAGPVEASNDNDTVLEQTGSVLEQLTALIQDEALPAEMRETLTAMVEKMDVAMAEKDLSVLQATMAEFRGTLTEFAASDAIPAQMFRTLSEILPAVVVAEKQLGDSLPRPVTAESVPDTANLELADNVADIQTLLAEKIDILLKDESLPPEIKEQLVKIVQTMESAIEQKDFAKLVIVTTEMRQTLADFAASDAVAPQISKQLGDILPAITTSEQKLADVVPRAQAENILAALIVTDQKLQSGTIVPTIETVELMQALDALKETIKQQGPEAALQKIVESLKAPAPESPVLPVLEILEKNPALLESLPPELGQALAQAVAPAERTIQQHLAVAGIAADIPKAAPEKIIDVLLAVENHIGPADIKADPAKAELAKIIADIKQTIDKDGMPAAVQKITEALQQVSVDGKASPILEIIASQPALLSALPVEMQANVRELKEFSILNNAVVTQQAEKIVDVVTVIDQQIKNGVIDKADPANAELVKIVADIKDTIKQEGLPAAAEKIAEALKAVAVEGKVPPLIEVLESQPALLAALPQDLQRSVDQIHKTALSVAVPVERQAERIVDVVAVLDQKIQSGAIDRADPANSELIKIVADIQKTIKEGGVPAAVEKITETLKQVTLDGKVLPIIEALAAQPAVLAVLPAELRTSIHQLQQSIPIPAVPIQVHAENIVAVAATLEQKIQSGAIDRADPANAEIVKAIADIQKIIREDGPLAAAEKITEGLKQASIDGKVPPIIAALSAQPAILASLPQDIRVGVEKIQQTVAIAAPPVAQQAKTITDIVAQIDQRIQSGAINGADPANYEIVALVAQLKDVSRQHGNEAVTEKVTEALQRASIDGKVPDFIEVLAKNPSVIAAVPELRSALQQVQVAAAVATPTMQPEKIIQVVEALHRSIESGAISKTDPVHADIVRGVAEIKDIVRLSGTEAAVLKIAEGLQHAAETGKMPPMIRAVVEQPAILESLPVQTRIDIQNIQQKIQMVPSQVEAQSRNIVNAFSAVEQSIQRGEISVGADTVATIASIKTAMEKDGGKAFVTDLGASIKNADPRIVEMAAVLTKPEVLKSLPITVQKDIINFQRTAIDAEARSLVYKNEVLPISREQQRDLKTLIEKSNLPPAEKEKYSSDIKSGQISIIAATKMLDNLEHKSPALDTSKARSELGALAIGAAAKANESIRVIMDVADERRAISAIVNLPLSADTLSRVMHGNVTKADVVAIQLAAGPTPTSDVSLYVAQALKPILKKQGRDAMEIFERTPAPATPKQVVENMREGRPITREQFRQAMSDPAIPVQERMAIRNYVAAQLQVLPHSQKDRNGGISSFERPREIKFDKVSLWEDKAWSPPKPAGPNNPPPKPQEFRPVNVEKFVRDVQTAHVDKKDAPFVREIIEKAKAGQTIALPEMHRLMDVAKMPPVKHLEISANMLPVQESRTSPEAKKEQPETGCPTGCKGDRGCCPVFNEASASDISKTANAVVGLFTNSRTDTTADKTDPSRVSTETYNAAVPRTEGRPELGLQDFLEPKKEQPDGSCPTGCKGDRGCCPAFKEASEGAITKTAESVIGLFKDSRTKTPVSENSLTVS